MNIVARSALHNNAAVYKKSDLIKIVSSTQIICNLTNSNEKQWYIYLVNEVNGVDERQITLNNNPTLNYADLVLQPQTLNYGTYRLVFTVTMTGTNANGLFRSQIDTFVQIVPSGLVISALKSSQPMYGGTIEIA